MTRKYIVVQSSHSSRELHVHADSNEEAKAKAARGEIVYYGEYREGPVDYWVICRSEDMGVS